MFSMNNDCWIWFHFTGNTLDESVLGLINEARRVCGEMGGEGTVTVLASGNGEADALKSLGGYGADRIIFLHGDGLEFYHGELFAKAVFPLLRKEKPFCMLMLHSPETSELAARLGAMAGSAVATRVADISVDSGGNMRGVRPGANEYIYEAFQLNGKELCMVTLLPSVLTSSPPVAAPEPEILMISPEISMDVLETKIVDVVEASPENMAVEDADIVVAAGRGVGKGDDFNLIIELADALGASIGGTRPVVDWQMLPFERQIGQTGKDVSPRLIVNCGISGANEYTAGMEKSHLTIAVNTDPLARIFKFADLGIIGDVHEVLPLVISRLREKNERKD